MQGMADRRKEGGAAGGKDWQSSLQNSPD